MNTAPSKLFGYSDWRLPNVVELKSMINYGASNPALWLMYGSGASGSPACNGACFSNVQVVNQYYWSSSTSASKVAEPSILLAWYTSFNNGEVSSTNKLNGLYVWPVRGGQ